MPCETCKHGYDLCGVLHSDLLQLDSAENTVVCINLVIELRVCFTGLEISRNLATSIALLLSSFNSTTG